MRGHHHITFQQRGADPRTVPLDAEYLCWTHFEDHLMRRKDVLWAEAYCGERRLWRYDAPLPHCREAGDPRDILRSRSR